MLMNSGFMKKLFWLLVILLSIIKISLDQAIPVSAIGYNLHDDALFIRQAGGFGLWLCDLLGRDTSSLTLAHELPKGGWLGSYNELILSKGPVYGLWIAFCFITGLPLLTAQHILYAVSGIVVVFSIKKEVPQYLLLLALFALFLFNPEFVSRVVRSGIYPALSVLIMACLFGLYSHRYAHLRKSLPWIVLLSCVLPLFWMTREEGIWLIPTIGLVLAGILYGFYKKHGFCRQLLIRAIVISVPLLFLFCATQFISTLNFSHYGTKCVVELKSDSFRRAYGSLLRVKHEKRSYVVVPGSVRNKIYSVSPSFLELQPYLEGEMGKKWQKFGCDVYPETCGEIGSGWFLWAFRDAVARAGYHSNGKKAASYYLKLATEINDACTLKKLECLPERNSLAPPLSSDEYQKIIRNIPNGLTFLLGFESLVERLNMPFYSQGSPETLDYFRDMTREELAPTKQSTDKPVSTLAVQTMTNSLKLSIKKEIAKKYQSVTPYLFYISLSFYGLIVVISVWKKRLSNLTFFSSALLLAIFCRLLILSLIDVTSFHGFNHYYLSPLYSFVLLFSSLVLIDVFRLIIPQKPNETA